MVERKKRGRPPISDFDRKDKVIKIRMSDFDIQAIKVMASTDGVSTSSFLRNLIEDAKQKYIEKRGKHW